MFRRLSLPRPIALPLLRGLAAAEWRRSVTALAALAAVALGTILGLMVTAATIRSDALGTVRAGPWRIFTDVGTLGVNPYARARQARTGEIPLAAAQGLTAVARNDSGGHVLDGRCTYRVSGSMPPAYFWTLEAASATGRPFDNPAGRQSFTSDEVLRDVAGHFTVTLSPVVVSGDWLPLPGSGPIMLVLRLYDTALVSGSGTREPSWPMIEALGCS